MSRFVSSVAMPSPDGSSSIVPGARNVRSFGSSVGMRSPPPETTGEAGPRSGPGAALLGRDRGRRLGWLDLRRAELELRNLAEGIELRVRQDVRRGLGVGEGDEDQSGR